MGLLTVGWGERLGVPFDGYNGILPSYLNGVVVISRYFGKKDRQTYVTHLTLVSTQEGQKVPQVPILN